MEPGHGLLIKLATLRALLDIVMAPCKMLHLPLPVRLDNVLACALTKLLQDVYKEESLIALSPTVLMFVRFPDLQLVRKILLSLAFKVNPVESAQLVRGA